MNYKILIITPGFPANEQDSTCVPYIQDYAIALANKIGTDKIYIISMQYPFTRKPYQWHGINVFPSGGANKKGFKYYFTLRRTQKRIQQLYKSHKFTIHAFWMGEAAFAGYYASKKYLSKFVVTFMGQDVKPGNRVMRYIDHTKTYFVTLSENHDKILEKNYGFNADAIIPFPLPNAQPNNHTERNIDLLFVGSLIPVKQPEQFIQIVAALKNEFPELKATIVGDGNLRGELESLVKENNLQQTINFTGDLPRESVFNLMNQSKVLLHTSSFEGQCLVYAEALAQGMYVVSYNVGRIENIDKHIVCNTVLELEQNSKNLLQQNLDYSPVKLINTENTINDYLKLYQGVE